MPGLPRYKFLMRGLHSPVCGTAWSLGEWQRIEAPLEMYKRGFHCCAHPFDAFSRFGCEILARVEVRGKHVLGERVECWEEMRINEAYKWEKLHSLELAICASELVLENFEELYPWDDSPRKAIEASRAVLIEDSEEKRLAAQETIRVAALPKEMKATAWLAAHAAADAAICASDPPLCSGSYAAFEAILMAEGSERSALRAEAKVIETVAEKYRQIVMKMETESA
jgi:hypothetical protein